MLTLITGLIAIALIGILSAAGYFYGGAIFTDNKVTAEAQKYINQAAQLSSAVTLYKSKGNQITSEFTLQELVDGEYLRKIPEGWEPGANSILREIEPGHIAAESICYVANKQAGFTFRSSEEDVTPYSEDTAFAIPNCNKEGLKNTVPCCTS